MIGRSSCHTDIHPNGGFLIVGTVLIDEQAFSLFAYGTSCKHTGCYIHEADTKPLNVCLTLLPCIVGLAAHRVDDSAWVRVAAI
jgi:hypothetical protein